MGAGTTTPLPGGALGRTVNGQAGAGAVEVFTRANGSWSGPVQLDLGAGAASGDELGSSVGVSADGSIVVAGAPGRTVNGQTGAGAAEVFTRANGVWSAPTQLDLGSSAAGSDGLGSSVALSADGNTVLAGAPLKKANGMSSAGAAEVFTRANDSWSSATQLDLGGSAAVDDSLGYSVALSADGKTALAGASDRTVNGQRDGAAEVFTQTAGSWSGTGQLDLGAKATGNNELGFSVALSAGGTTALVGAIGRTVNGQTAGAAEAFTSSSGAWSAPTQLDLGSSAAGSDELGWSVALDGAGSTALLGAPDRAADGQQTAGAAEAYTSSSGAWGEPTQLDLGASPNAFTNLGYSVSVSADGNTALLGAPYRTVNEQTDAGAAEVLSRDPTGRWTDNGQLDLGGSAAVDDYLGSSVALNAAGNVALVGAPDRSVNATTDGSAEVFAKGPDGTWSKTAQLDLGAAAAGGDSLGSSVALNAAGNVALVGAPQGTVNGQRHAGAAEVFTLTNGSWSGPIQLDLGAAAAAGDNLGSSVALSWDGSVALAGAPQRTVSAQSTAGAAEVFTLTNGSWSGPTQLDLGGTAAAGDNLGSSVALSADGKTALVGAYGRMVNVQNVAGAAEVFTQTNGAWGSPTQLDLGTGAANSNELGSSVALDAVGDTAFVGAPRRTVNGQSQAGAAELFTLSNGSWSAPTQLDLGTRATGGDELGYSVALSADGNTGLAGVPYRSVINNTLTQAGAAEVFSAVTEAGSAARVTAGGSATASLGGSGPNTAGSISATASGGTGTVTVEDYYGNPSGITPPGGRPELRRRPSLAGKHLHLGRHCGL